MVAVVCYGVSGLIRITPPQQILLAVHCYVGLFGFDPYYAGLLQVIALWMQYRAGGELGWKDGEVPDPVLSRTIAQVVFLSFVAWKVWVPKNFAVLEV